MNFDCPERFEADPETDGVVMIGEIGGTMKWMRAAGPQHDQASGGFIAGRTAERQAWAAGAVLGSDDTADAKILALREAGLEISDSPAGLGHAMATALGLTVGTA